jgi:DNA-binding LytR/AlgR family response regulator
MLERLGPAGFVRIHRSYVVNAAHVVELAPWTHGERTVRLADGASLVSSRSYRDEVARLAGEHP